MDLQDLLAPGKICFLKSTDKIAVIDELLALINATGTIPDPAALREGILHRESLMSTGVGLGIAIPHARLDGIDAFQVAVGISAAPVTDYEAIDGEPIRIVILIIAIKDQHKDYIRLLSRIVTRLKEAGCRDALLAATTPEEVQGILTKSE